MATYSFVVPSFHIAEIRSIHTDTLVASTALRVMNANGSLHRDHGTKGVTLGDRKAGGDVVPGLEWNGVDVPDPTPDNPDGGAVYWTFILTNAGHDDGAVLPALNKAADAWAGALAGKALDKDTGGGSSILFALASVGVVAAQEVMNLLAADCDGIVASGAFVRTSAELAKMMPPPALRFATVEDNPGAKSPAGCGANSRYLVNYTMLRLQWHDQFAVAFPGSLRNDSPLIVFSRIPQAEEIFWIGANGDVSSTWRADNVDNGAWHQQFGIAIPNSVRAGSPLVPLLRVPGHEEMFWIGANGDVSSTWRADNVDNGQWHPQFALAFPGSVRNDSPLIVFSRIPKAEEIFWVGANGDVSSTWRADNVDNGAWHQQSAVAPAGSVKPGSPLVVRSRSPQHEELFWIGTDDSIMTTWRDDETEDGRWHETARVVLPGTVRVGSPLALLSRFPATQEVFWVGSNGDVSTNWWEDTVSRP
jgi:hypothetical protein